MRGQTVVLDSSNVDAVIADATGELPADAKAAPEVKVEVKPEPEGKINGAKLDEAEATDENGLTEAERKDLTEKMQRAIGKKHRALKEAEEFAAAQFNEKRLLEDHAAKLERELNRIRAQAQHAPEAKVEAEPKREDFKSDAEFNNAMIDYRVDQKLKAEKAEEQKRAEAERMAKIQADAEARVAKARELVPDFAEKMESLGEDDRIPNVVAGYMQESELIGEIAYHLATHKDELAKLQKMTPARALVEIGKIESRLEPFGKKSPSTESNTNGATPSSDKSTATEPSPEAKPRVSAPIVPLSTSSASQVEKPEAQMSYAEAKAAWQRKRGVQLGRRERH